jgi:hypothetical protein
VNDESYSPWWSLLMLLVLLGLLALAVWSS